jgi:hypothetical protein
MFKNPKNLVIKRLEKTSINRLQLKREIFIEKSRTVS